MAKQTQRHTITDTLYVYQQDNSKRWYARFTLYGTWYTKTTKERELQPAIVRAIGLQAEYKVKLDNNLSVVTVRSNQHSFLTVAGHAIKRMQDSIVNREGKAIYVDYIQVLEKYHKTYFDKIPIKNIDTQKLKDFDTWRKKQMQRVPAQSTVLTHNAAMQRVFDEAVICKIITALELPVLENTGKVGERRAAFTDDEYRQVLAAAKKWITKGKKQITRDTRTLLYYYMQFAILTGMRPGKEIDHLTWGDVHKRKIKGKRYTVVTVRKGKTTKYTGTREIVCKDGVNDVLKDMKSTLLNAEDTDLIFTMPNGDKSSQIGRNFGKLLDMIGLKSSAFGNRTLYSLRHSYITWQLQNKTDMAVIAVQCGTSVEMIQRHYSHIVPTMFADELSGSGGSLDLTSLSYVDISNLINDGSEGILVIKNGDDV